MSFPQIKSSTAGIIFFLLVISCTRKTDNRFEVKGTVKNFSGGTVYLEEASLGNTQPAVIDSAAIAANGTFTLTPVAAEESLYILRLNADPSPVASFINDTKRIIVTVDPSDKIVPYAINGSPASETLRNYLFTSNEKLSNLFNERKGLDTLKGNDSTVNAALARRKTDIAAYKDYTTRLINESKSPSLAVFILGSYQSYASNPALGLEPLTGAEMTDYLNRTAAKFPEHKGLALLKTGLEPKPQGGPAAQSNLLNKPAPPFTLPDVNGKPLSLSSFKGKYVLVDFWASWCRPCRAENPNVVRAYQQFKDKNFTILGVSLDKQKDAWTKAIKEDNLAWSHVSDLKFWESAVVPLYGIEGIPYNVLVNPEGVVVAENLRESELRSKLSEVLK